MESNKNLSQNQGTGSSSKDRTTTSTGSTGSSPSQPGYTPNKPNPTGSPSTTGSITPPATTSNIGSSGTTGYSGTQTSASAPQRAREQGADSTIDQAKHAVTNAYDKTSEVLSSSYDQAMSYGRENPGKLTLIAFGAGIGIGLLLASSASSGRSRTNRIAEPVVNALSQVAMEFFR